MQTPFNYLNLSALGETLNRFIQSTTGIYDDNLYICEMLKPLVYEEFIKADMADSKYDILQRVVQRTSRAMSLDPDKCSIVIPDDIVKMIDDLYNRIKTGDVKLNALNAKYNAFKNQDCHDVATTKNLIREFQKDNEVTKENSNNKREKVLKNNDLNILLAVDGMSGCQPCHLVNYIHNLAISDEAPEKRHVASIRAIYRTLPQILTGTDSVHFVLKMLLEIYHPFLLDLNYKASVEREIENIDNFLRKQAERHEEVATLLDEEYVSRMKEMYCSNLDQDQLKKRANDQISLFVHHVAKPKSENGKRETFTKPSSMKRKVSVDAKPKNENAKPKNENDKPKNENAKPKNENDKPKNENAKLKNENDKTKNENDKPKNENDKPKNENNKRKNGDEVSAKPSKKAK